MTSPRPTPEAIGRLVAARPLKDLARTLAQTRAATASGLWGSSLAAVVAAVEAELRRPVILVCGHLDEADDLADDLELFVGRRPDVLPALELGGGLGQMSEEQVSNRMRLISRLAGDTGYAEVRGSSLATSRKGGDAKAPATADTPLLVAPIQALMQSVP